MKKSVKVSLFTMLSIVLAFGMMLFSGCSSSSDNTPTPAGTPTLQSITVSPAAPSITTGGTTAFTAAGVLSDSTPTTVVVTWSSSNTAIATIDATTGLATAVAVGTTTITATEGSVSGTATLTVTAPAVATYSGTLYMASEGGGHIGVYPVTIDPTNTTSPITVDVTGVKRIQLRGAPADSANKVVFHDIRFDDASDGGMHATKIYYSAIMSRPSATGVADIGYVDLAAANTAPTNNGIDSVIDIDASAADTIAFALGQIAPDEFGTGSRILYCGSGMDKTNGYYLPMSMSFPPYVDAVPVAAIATAGSHVTSATPGFKRTGLSQIDADAIIGTGPQIPEAGNAQLGNPPMAFIHGGSSNTDGGALVYMSTNLLAGLNQTTNLAGLLRGYIVNATDLETGTMDPSKVVSRITMTVAPSNSATSDDHTLQGSIAYRASFTPDDKYILQSGSDRAVILSVDPTTHVMTLYDDTNNDAVKVGGGKTGIEVHDVIATPDSKYAILSIRYYADATQKANGYKTSGVQLYDINNKHFVGGITPTCGSDAGACHPATGDFASRPTCGVLFRGTASGAGLP